MNQFKVEGTERMLRDLIIGMPCPITPTMPNCGSRDSSAVCLRFR